VKLYAITDIFYSLQGEGVRAGTPAVFIRFADCKLKGPNAPAGVYRDGEFPVHDRLTANEVAKLTRICSFRCNWTVLAGAEPALQVDVELVGALHAVGFRIAIETSGIIPLDQLACDWVTVAPKPGAQLRVRCADEIRYVIRHGDPIPLPPVPARHYLLSPAFNGDRLDPEDLEWCIQLVKDNPRWRLSVRQHKIWKIE
jgi:7-carboxy-7-deazaguanine synthase